MLAPLDECQRLSNIVLKELRALPKCKHCPGAPPKGDAERKLQDYIDKQHASHESEILNDAMAPSLESRPRTSCQNKSLQRSRPAAWQEVPRCSRVSSVSSSSTSHSGDIDMHSIMSRVAIVSTHVSCCFALPLSFGTEGPNVCRRKCCVGKPAQLMCMQTGTHVVQGNRNMC